MGADGCWRMWAQGRGVREHWHGGGPVGGSKGNVDITKCHVVFTLWCR